MLSMRVRQLPPPRVQGHHLCYSAVAARPLHRRQPVRLGTSERTGMLLRLRAQLDLGPSPMALDAPSFMGVVSAAPCSAVLTGALVSEVPARSPEPDPRRVITPLRIDAVVERLSVLGILNDWQGAVYSLQEGFSMLARQQRSPTPFYS